MARPTKLPEWASTAGSSDLIEPSNAKKESGWRKVLVGVDSIPEKPPYQEFNWWQNLVYNWASYWAELTDDEFTQIKNIDTTNISTAQWGYVGTQDQATKTTDNVTFNSVEAGETITSVINEQVPGAGVIVDGVLLKDGGATFDAFGTDVITEKTSGAGVRVDGYLIKDGIGGGYEWFSGLNAVEGVTPYNVERAFVQIGSTAVRLSFSVTAPALYPPTGKKFRVDVKGATPTNFLMLRADTDDAQEIARMTSDGYIEVYYNASTGNPNLKSNWTVVKHSLVNQGSTGFKQISTFSDTLTEFDSEIINVDISGGGFNFNLPAGGIKAGRIFRINAFGGAVNEALSSQVCGVSALNGGFIGDIHANGSLVVQAVVDTPNGSLLDGQWRLLEQIEGGYRHIYAPSTNNYNHTHAQPKIIKVTDPSGPINIRLTSGSTAGPIPAGSVFKLLVNGATETNYVAFQASNGATHLEIDRIGSEGFIEVMALRNNPTTAAHWKIVDAEYNYIVSATGSLNQATPVLNTQYEVATLPPLRKGIYIITLQGSLGLSATTTTQTVNTIVGWAGTSPDLLSERRLVTYGGIAASTQVSLSPFFIELHVRCNDNTTEFKLPIFSDAYYSGSPGTPNFIRCRDGVITARRIK